MGRPERPVCQNSAELHDFAVALRSLREQAGRPTYEGMARRTGASRTALAQAASGQHLPRWRTVAAYVEACRGDVPDWRRRWDALGVVSGPVTDEDIGTPEQPPTQEVPAGGTGEPVPERRRFHRRLLIGGGALVAAALLAVVTLDRVGEQRINVRAR